MNTETKEINWALFERTVAAIKANPAHWYQGWWHCGTSHCFAGFAHIIDLQDRSALPAGFNLVADKAGCFINGEDTPHKAQELLGLTEDQWRWLFDEDRTLADFDECIERRAIAVYATSTWQTVWP